MKIFPKTGIASLLVAVMMISPVALAAPAVSAIDLGTASEFAVVSGGTFTNGNDTTITGDIGTFDTSLIPGGIILTAGSDFHPGDAEALAAITDVTTAYNTAEALTGADTTTLAGTEEQLSGKTLTPGLYSFDSTVAAVNLTGVLTLDAGGDVDAVWVFQTDDELVTAPDAQIVLTNGAQSDNVFWQVEGAVTLGADTHFVGNLLAQTDITLLDGEVEVQGRLLSVLGNVSLNNSEADFTNVASAVIPVVVPVTPALPATGLGSSQSILLSLLALAGVLGLVSLSFVAKKSNK